MQVDFAGLFLYVASCGCRYNCFLVNNCIYIYTHTYIHIYLSLIFTYYIYIFTHYTYMHVKALDHQRETQIILQHVSLGEEVWKGNLLIFLVIVMH